MCVMFAEFNGAHRAIDFTLEQEVKTLLLSRCVLMMKRAGGLLQLTNCLAQTNVDTFAEFCFTVLQAKSDSMLSDERSDNVFGEYRAI